MNGKLIAGALAAVLWGGSALADEYQVKSTTQTEPSTTQVQTQTTAPDATLVPGQSTTTTTVQVPADDYSSRMALNDKDLYKKDDNKGHLRGVTVLVGGGVEGYTGSLASQLQAGPAWDATVALKPTKVLGLELAYSGATNEISRGSTGTTFSAGEARGPDIIRNGGRAMVSLGLTASAVQPYVAGGVGFDHYTVRAADAAFRSDNAGSIPFAAGLRTHIAGFTADARVQYGVLFSSDFARDVASRDIVGVNSINSGNYQGTLSLGTSF